MSRPYWKNPLAILLALSLAANAFIGARAVGTWMSGADNDGPPGGRGFRAYLREAPAEIRTRVREIRQARREAFDAKRGALRAAQAQRRAAVMAEPFEADALRAATTAVLAARAELRAIIDDGFVELLEELPVEERRRLADMLGRRRPPPPP